MAGWESVPDQAATGNGNEWERIDARNEVVKITFSFDAVPLSIPAFAFGCFQVRFPLGFAVFLIWKKSFPAMTGIIAGLVSSRFRARIAIFPRIVRKPGKSGW